MSELLDSTDKCKSSKAVCQIGKNNFKALLNRQGQFKGFLNREKPRMETIRNAGGGLYV